MKAYSIIISFILLAFVVVYLRPDMFPFLKNSNIYNAISKTFPEKYLPHLEKPKDESRPLESIKPTPKLINPIIVQTPSVPKTQPNLQAKNFRNPVSDYWYIIELKSGETILTQVAVVTKDFVSAMMNGRVERRISKIDVKEFARKKI